MAAESPALPRRLVPTWLSARTVLGLVVVVLVGLVSVVPVLFLIAVSFNTAGPGQPVRLGLENWFEAFGDPRVLGAIWTTVALAVTRLVIATVVGIVFAWLIARTDMPGGSVLEFLFWVAFFAPSLPLTLGWILLLDPRRGLLNTLIAQLPFVEQGPFDVFSFWGIIWIHLTATSIPVAVILFTPAFRQMGAQLEESARMCGASTLVTLRRVTVPLLVPAILPATIIMLIRSLEAFEIELIVGVPAGIYVYSTRIYELLQEAPVSYGVATALGALFLIVLMVLALLYQWSVRGRRFTTVTGQGFSRQRIRLGKWRWVAFGGMVGYLVVSFGLSMVFLVLGSFMRRFGFFNLDEPFTLGHWQELLDDPVLVSSLMNSLVMGLATAVLGVLLFSLVAYVIVRSKLTGKEAVGFMVWLPWAIPGVLLGLALLWLFLATPLRGLLYGTMAGLVLAMLIKELPVATQLLKGGFSQLGHDLEEAARVSGASWLTTYRLILLPLLAPVAVNVAVLAFQGAVRDIGTVVFLYSHQSRPLSILLLEYSFSGELERGAAVGIILVAMIATVAFAARMLGFRAGPAA